MSKSSKGQRTKIKKLQGKLKLSDAEYRELVMSVQEGFASSCTELSFDEAGLLIEILEKKAEEAGIKWEKRSPHPAFGHPLPGGEGQGVRAKKYDDLGHRPGFASPAQLRLIEVLWKKVSFVKNDEYKRAFALDSFIYKIAKVQKNIWLEARDVQRVVKAIEAMMHSPLKKGEKGGCQQ